MNNQDKAQEIRTPLSIMLDMAKMEIKDHVAKCMQTNNIPPELMIYILKDILLDLTQTKAEILAEEYILLQKSISSQGGNRDGD